MPDFQNINSQISIGLPASVPDGFQNEEVRAAVRFFINTQQNFLRALEQYVGVTQKEQSLWQYLTPQETLLSHQLNRLYVIAGVDLSYGSFVHLYNDAGILKAEKANSTDYLKPASGFCSIIGGALTGEFTEVIVGTGILPITGILPAQSFYLSVVGGQASIVPDTAAGHLEQFLGFGMATDIAYVCIPQGVWIKH